MIALTEIFDEHVLTEIKQKNSIVFTTIFCRYFGFNKMQGEEFGRFHKKNNILQMILERNEALEYYRLQIDARFYEFCSKKKY